MKEVKRLSRRSSSFAPQVTNFLVFQFQVWWVGCFEYGLKLIKVTIIQWSYQNIYFLYRIPMRLRKLRPLLGCLAPTTRSFWVVIYSSLSTKHMNETRPVAASDHSTDAWDGSLADLGLIFLLPLLPVRSSFWSQLLELRQTTLPSIRTATWASFSAERATPLRDLFGGIEWIMRMWIYFFLPYSRP